MVPILRKNLNFEKIISDQGPRRLEEHFGVLMSEISTLVKIKFAKNLFGLSFLARL